MQLYRPTGLKELELIFESGLRKFPPRLPDQPIFYPVTNAGCARQIAEEWNTKSNSFAGYVTRFNVNNRYVQKFERKIVGGKNHEELWVPAEELEEFNENLIGHIDVIAAYFGEEFKGSMPEPGLGPKNVTPVEYLRALHGTFNYNIGDFRAAVVLNCQSIYCNYPYWKSLNYEVLEFEGKRDTSQTMEHMKECWHDNFPGIPLPTECEIRWYEKEDLA